MIKNRSIIVILTLMILISFIGCTKKPKTHSHDFDENGKCKGCEELVFNFELNNNNKTWKITGLKDNKIESFSIPSTYDGMPVTKIAKFAFRGNNSLKSVTIPESITKIKKSAFNGCDSLEKVNIESIESWLSIDFEDEDANPLKYAHNLYLNNELVENVVVPENISWVSAYAFYGCTSIKTVSTHEEVWFIDKFAFAECTNLTDIYIGSKKYWHGYDDTDLVAYTFFSDSKKAREYLVDTYCHLSWNEK